MVSIKEGKKFFTDKCSIPTNKLDSRGDLGCNSSDWRVGKYNGPPAHLKKFIPPKEFTAIGIKVKGCFDGGNDVWLGTDNIEGEWYVGYHGVRTVDAIYNIIFQGFKKGPGQSEKNSNNINPLTNSLYPKCGEGAYFAQDINTAESYTNSIYYNGKNYKVVFMCRINPYSCRISDQGYERDYMITNGNYNTKDEARPYRILIKQVS